MGVDETRASSPGYDYVLVAGPGRSGSTFLYRLLNAHPAFTAPEIKEGYYYRSVRRFDRARRKLRRSDTILLDVANTAWADPRLAVVAALHRRGWRASGRGAAETAPRARSLGDGLLRQSRVCRLLRVPGGSNALRCATASPQQALARILCARRGCARSPLRHPGRQPARGARCHGTAVSNPGLRSARHAPGQSGGAGKTPVPRGRGQAGRHRAACRRRPAAAAGPEGRGPHRAPVLPARASGVRPVPERPGRNSPRSAFRRVSRGRRGGLHAAGRRDLVRARRLVARPGFPDMELGILRDGGE